MMFWLLHLCLITSVLSQEIIHRITLGQTNWGEWSDEIKCPENIRVAGFRLQVEEKQGFFADDTGLNGLQLKCRDGQNTKKIEGPYGDWHDWMTCRSRTHVTEFNLQSLAPRGPLKDDFGATNLDFMCSDNRELLGEGIDRGHWSGYRECPSDSYFCGVKAKIERKAFDHTGLNKITFLCCQKDSSSWGMWSTWAPCSVLCGHGYSTRERTCNVQNGVGCLLKSGARATTETQKKKCFIEECIVPSSWGGWSSWSPCSSSCSWGYSSRTRECGVSPGTARGSGQSEGAGCQLRNGTLATTETQKKKCSGVCPGAGNWGPWQSASPCSYDCERSEKKMKRECNSPPPTNYVGCRTSSGKRALVEYMTQKCPPPRECKFTCSKEKGFCVKSDGTDQNDGVITLLSQEMDRRDEQQLCYKKCREYPDATGCEVIWNQPNRGCYAHTEAIARGNLADNHFCWVFSKCKSEMDCTTFHCDHSYSPVCGSDRVTYNNLCLFEKGRCQKKNISKLHDGKCIDPCEMIQCGQGRISLSCASNGRTYDSCELAKITCRNSSITYLHPGPCKSCDKNICTEQYTPVCGSDGKTYGNICKLKKAACVDQSIKLKYRGKCSCVTACPLNYAPICGSDGKTYSNRCYLEVVNCKLRQDGNTKEVKILYNGECKGHKKCAATTNTIKVGEHSSQCTEEGLFKPLQCHPSTGYCWCVNPYTGGKIPRTDIKPGDGKSQELSTAKCIVAHHKGLIGKWTITFASGTTDEFQIIEDGSVRDMFYKQNSIVNESENLKEFPTSHGWIKTAFGQNDADNKKMTVYMRWWRDDRIEMRYFCGRDCANVRQYCETSCQKRYGGVQNYCCAGKGSKTITTEYLKRKRKGKDGYSFSIQLEVFEGDIKYYDVIVTELGKDPTFPRTSPGDYSNEDILLGVDGLYVAGRIKDKSQFGKEFKIGGSPGKGNRKRRALATPNNKPLKKDVYYGVFVRGYITEDYYMTSTWYPPVIPNDKQTGSWKIAVTVVVVIILIVIVVVLIAIHITKRRKGATSSPSVPTTNGYNNREFQLGTNLATAPNMTLPSQPNGKTIPESYENVTLPEKPRYEAVQYKPPAKPAEKQVYEEPTEVTLPNVKPTIPDQDESWKVRPRPKPTKKLANEVLPNVNNLEQNDGPAVISVKQFSEEPPKPIYETDYQDPSIHHSTTNPFRPSNMAPIEQLYQEIPHYNAIPAVGMTRQHPNTPPPEYSELSTTPAIPEPFNPQMPGYNQLGMTPAAYSELNETNIPQALNMPMPGYNRLDPSLTSQNPNGLYDNSHYAVPNVQTTDNLYMGLQPENPNTDSTA